MCRWKRHEREGRLEFEVHSEWMRRTRRIGQMRPADAEGSKARQGVWVLGPGSRQEWAGWWKGGQVGRLGIRWGHLDQSYTLDSDEGLCLLGAGSKYPGTCLLGILCRVASKSMMPCHNTSFRTR